MTNARRRAGLLAFGLALLIGAPLGLNATRATATPGLVPALPSAPLGHAGRWITDASGRAVVLHGLNQVFKVPPYTPSANGFGADDAAFLQANGFNVVRVGVIWAAVEPRPGVYDDRYLASVASTVNVLGAHGILSLLDFHQDLYNELFQGEGAPAWAVQTGGLPNPRLGFPGNYLGNPALEHALDRFYTNSPGPGGVGLADRFAAAWAHVAARFRANPNVVGYELLNEPFPGTLWEPCIVPFVGCPLFDRELTGFYERVVPAIRKVDRRTMIWFEPNVIFNDGVATDLGTISDSRSAFAFHDYCLVNTFLPNYQGCKTFDDLVFANANRYAGSRGIPDVMTEFGATGDLPTLDALAARSDANMVGWIEWAYTGNDKTSSSPNGQALVLDPSKPAAGENVLTAKLRALARPYPQVIAGTPLRWAFDPSTRVFSLSYSALRAGGAGVRFGAGAMTDIAAPAIQYPAGYSVRVTGGRVVSAPRSSELQIASCPGAGAITVTIRPGAGSTGSC